MATIIEEPSVSDTTTTARSAKDFYTCTVCGIADTTVYIVTPINTLCCDRTLYVHPGRCVVEFIFRNPLQCLSCKHINPIVVFEIALLAMLVVVESLKYLRSHSSPLCVNTINMSSGRLNELGCWDVVCYMISFVFLEFLIIITTVSICSHLHAVSKKLYGEDQVKVIVPVPRRIWYRLNETGILGSTCSVVVTYALTTKYPFWLQALPLAITCGVLIGIVKKIISHSKMLRQDDINDDIYNRSMASGLVDVSLLLLLYVIYGESMLSPF